MEPMTGQTASTSIQRPRLRRDVQPRRAERKPPHVIAVTSGKGGVGKTNITANLGYLLRQFKRRVLLLDADLGLANVDIVLGLKPEFNLGHVFSGDLTLEEVLTKGPGGMRVLPATSGIQSVTDLTDAQKLMLMQQLESLEEAFDYLLIDTAAGISDNVIYFTLAAQTRLIVITPEPTSLTDAYALIKVLSRDYHQREFVVLANGVKDHKEGVGVYEQLLKVADRFLDVSLDYLGHVPHDRHVSAAVRAQRPFCEVYPECAAARGLRDLARAVVDMRPDPLGSDLGLLWRNMLVPRD